VQEWGTGNAGTVSVGSGAILTVNGADKGTLQQSTISGSGGLTLAASGNTVLRLYGNNTYSGATSVSGGTLQLAGTAGSGGLTGTSAVSLSGGVLLLSSSNVVNDSATVSLSGGTIQRGGNVSEVFGDLSVTSASFLDYGAANDVGTIRFGSYTPSSLLTVQNFLPGNKLQFGNTISSTDLNNASLFSFSSNFTTGTESGFFTITAIPEPSTYVAAAGLLALFLWPVRRRLIKDAKSILGLRPTGRDRIEAYRNA
jgi:autotransporter-associated beta strand protein